MSIDVLKLTDVKRKTEERPRHCPYCQGETFQRWGQVNKPVKDVHLRQLKVYRYKCCHCKRTFRHYPQGSSHADQTERLRMLAILLWTLSICHSNFGELETANQFHDHLAECTSRSPDTKTTKVWKPVRVVGLDGAYVLGWGEKQPVLVAVNLGMEEIRELMEFLPPDGNKILYALWKQLPGRRSKPDQARFALERLRDLLLRLSPDWQRYCAFQTEAHVPWTNNPTERAIGKMKMRARTVRGYKSWQGKQAGLLLTGLLAR